MTSDRVTRLSESQPARLGAIRNPAGRAAGSSSGAGGPLAPYRFDTTFHSNGSYTMRCAGAEASNERVLARRLVESDMPDGPIEGGRVGRLDWTFPSLHRFAAGAVTASEMEVTPERLHPTLRAAVVALRAAKKVAA